MIGAPTATIVKRVAPSTHELEGRQWDLHGRPRNTSPRPVNPDSTRDNVRPRHSLRHLTRGKGGRVQCDGVSSAA